MIVRVRCVAPYRHVPRGGRRARLDHVATVHPLEVAEVDPAVFRALPGADRAHERDGALWMRLRALDGGGRIVDLARDAFLDWLSAPGPSRSEIEVAFRRTPLLASVIDMPPSRRCRIVRGATRGVEGCPYSREVIRDLGSRALAAAAGLLLDGVALAGDAVMVRARPRMFVEAVRGGWGTRVEPWAATDDSGPLGLPPDAARAPGATPSDPRAAAILGAIRPADGDDLRDVAGHHLHHAAPALARHVAMHDRRRAGLLARVEPLSELASIGALDRAECLHALDLLAEVAPILAGCPFEVEPWRWRAFARGAIDIDAGDAVALGNMAP